MSVIEKVQLRHVQILHISNLGVPNWFLECFANIARVPRENSKLFLRYTPASSIDEGLRRNSFLDTVL